MSELKRGSIVHLTNGDTITVEKELGRGGQGIVYAVDYKGEKKALKWYPYKHEIFYNNLKTKIECGAPSPIFIWPEYLTQVEDGCFGYVMKLRPGDYYEFGTFLLAKHSFDSFYAITVAAMDICEGFKALHALGFCYHDLIDGFFINPQNGHVLICDNDNIFPQQQNFGIRGNPRYMAPEVVGGQNPDAHSDKFSLALILFMLFYGNHPFEGKRVASCPCMTENDEKKFYGSEMTFIFDPANQTNTPVREIHNNVIRLWPIFPEILRETFITEFSADKLNNPTRRLTELQWLSVITAVRDALILCPLCMGETFVDVERNDNICMQCKRAIALPHTLVIENRKLALTADTKYFINRDDVADILVHKSPDQKILLMKNLTEKHWLVETPSGRSKILNPMESMPVKTGMKISFVSFNKRGEIISTEFLDNDSFPRRLMVIFFLVDCSRNMYGNKIKAVNDAIRNMPPMVQEISNNNPDAEIKVAVLKFSTGCEWVYSTPKYADDFVWVDVEANGETNLGEACKELNQKLSRKEFLQSKGGSFPPAVILLSDGHSTDDFKSGLAVLKKNNWFSHAIKSAFAISTDADSDVLDEFTGNKELVYNINDFQAIKRFLRPYIVSGGPLEE